MSSILMNITAGPENPTKVALGLLIARTAAEEGHDVSVFLVGDAVFLMHDQVLDAVHGVGLGAAREHFDALQERGASFYVSRMSSNARAVSEGNLENKNAQWATPKMLVDLSLQHDRTFTY